MRAKRDLCSGPKRGNSGQKQSMNGNLPKAISTTTTTNDDTIDKTTSKNERNRSDATTTANMSLVSHVTEWIRRERKSVMRMTIAVSSCDCCLYPAPADVSSLIVSDNTFPPAPPIIASSGSMANKSSTSRLPDQDVIEFDYDDSNSEDGEHDIEEVGEAAENGDSDENSESHAEPKGSEGPEIPTENLLSRIKNKLRRRQMFDQQESEQRAASKKRKRKKEVADGPKRVTRTIDNSCGFAETLSEEVLQPGDPFSCYFDREKDPKLLMTTVDHPRTKTIRFCQEFARTIPNTEFKFRKNCSIRGTMKAAHERGFTHLLVVNQDARRPNGLLLIHLPDGPTANFKLSSVKYHKDIRRHGAPSSERPEIIVNNFHTRLGQTVGRFFVSLCHFDPEFKGRRVVTFHNQRDYIFFRHHRYQFKNSKRVALQEIGPRFTLRLRWFQKGPFDTKNGQFDWLSKREEKDSSGRRLFFL